MRKIVCVLLAVVMLLGLAACRKSPANNQSGENQNGKKTLPAAESTVTEKVESESVEDAAGETAASASELLSYSIYIPNNNADGFEEETIRTEEISAETVLAELKERNVLPDAVSINRFNMENGLIMIDFNQAFANAVCAMGTSGELMIVGSVVNTFLDAFQAEFVYFTVNGQILESGHTIYDFAMPFFSLAS